ANLLLARSLGRVREIAVRRAIGGSTRHILRFVITESLLLAIAGGAAGLILSWAILRTAPSILPAGLLPQGIRLEFNARVALCASALTGITGLFVAVVPVWHAMKMPLVEVLAGGGRTLTTDGRLRRALVIAEVALAVLLLSGAGLLVRTFLA